MMSEQDYSGHKERPTEPIVKPIIGNIAPLQARIAELEGAIRACRDSNDNGESYSSPTPDSAYCLSELFSLVDEGKTE